MASIVPLLAAALQFSTAGPFSIIVLTAVSLHLLSANLLIAKFIGSRVDIGPVAATVGMLFSSWLWGAIGLLPAVPLTAFVKLVADCHPALLPISNLLGGNSTWGAALHKQATQQWRERSRFCAIVFGGGKSSNKNVTFVRVVFDFLSS